MTNEEKLKARVAMLREALADPCGGYNNHDWTDGKPCSRCGWTYQQAGAALDALSETADVEAWLRERDEKTRAEALTQPPQQKKPKGAR